MRRHAKAEVIAFGLIMLVALPALALMAQLAM
jgi:hypothetical protein